MTLYQFNLLDELAQLKVLLKLDPIAERKDEKHTYNLYVIDFFYVEVRYGIKDKNRTSLRSFNTTTPLEPYLDLIDISEIIL
jgi:hypothetical protein